MNILLVTTKWNSTSYGVDGGSMTALNVVESLHNKVNCDILIPDSLAAIIPEGYFGKIHTYEISHIDNEKDKFHNRRIMSLTVADKVNTLIIHYDKVVILHVFNALYLPSRLQPNDFKKIILFPMFMSASYAKSSEIVPEWYVELEFKVISLIRRIITPSEFEGRQLMEIYHTHRDSIRVIPRWVSPYYHSPVHRKSPNGIITMTSVSSFRKQKRVSLAIDLLCDLRKRGIKASMIIVGSIQDEAEYMVFQDALAKAPISISNCIKHFKYLSPQELNSLYSRADFNVSFSACETFGRSVIESLCCGLPNLILDDSGDLQSLFGKGHGALYCSTIEEMGALLSKTLSDEIAYKQLTKEARIYGERFKNNCIKTMLADCIIEEIK